MDTHSPPDDPLDKARDQVLVDNTAQTVFKHLEALENKRARIMSRWVWELLQNGRDVAPAGGGLAIELSVDKEHLVFRHNGSHFTEAEIAHLIYHGSTKQSGAGTVGHFGSGFISTHLISRRIRVRGGMRDGRHFDFVLNRAGSSPESLSQAMYQSWEEFKSSLGTSHSTDGAGFTTEYAYDLGDDTSTAIKSGVSALRACAPLVLAFNPAISSISIGYDGDELLYKRAERQDLGDSIALHRIQRREARGEHVDHYVAMAEKEGLAVAIQLVESGDKLSLVRDRVIPRISLAFPLSGTEEFCFPAIVNSESFVPTEDRDGIFLGTGDNAANRLNMKLTEEACDLLLALMSVATKQRWAGAHALAKLPDLGRNNWLDENWLSVTIRDKLINQLRGHDLLINLSGGEIAPLDAWIPFGTGAVDQAELWQLTCDLRAAPARLPAREDTIPWAENVSSWIRFLEKRVEELPEVWTVRKLAYHVARLGSMGGIEQALVDGADTLGWLNKLHALIIKAGQISLFDELELLPDQVGKLKKRKEISKDAGIGERLKDIAELVGIDIRGRLLHTGILSRELVDLLPQKNERDLLSETLEELKGKAGKNSAPNADFKEANLKLFAWVAENNYIDFLDGYPALTELSSEDSYQFLHLTRSLNEDTPLAPHGCWPQAASEFIALFPKQYVLLSAYYAHCQDANLWANLASYGYVRTSPLYASSEQISRFLPDEPLPETVKGENHQTTDVVDTNQIAFLTKKDVGLIDTARKSKSKALGLLNFLVSFILTEDPGAFIPSESDCECGKSHRYYPAGWLIPLRDRRWVPLDANRAETPNAQSLSSLLQGSNEMIQTLSAGKPAQLLKTIGVSVADFLLRTVAEEETDRISLALSMTEIFEAAGRDQQRIGLIAEEISSNPEILDQIEEGRRRRERIHRNQFVGASVEKLLAQALSSSGLNVTRTGVGSDYEVESDVVDDAGEVLLKINKGTTSYLIEMKATTGADAKMTVKQAETATKNKASFVLCMVTLPDRQVTEDIVRQNARFVFDIGERLEPLWLEYDTIEALKKDAKTLSGDIELVIIEAETRFKVGIDTWRSGSPFEEAVKIFLGEK